MSSSNSVISTETVPFLTAPLTPDYPQFISAIRPDDGSSVEAWRGFIQPFADDDTARAVLADIEAGKQLYISEGRIRGGKYGSHWANPLLINMAVKCDVLICIQDNALPRAYLMSPRFKEHYESTEIHPHPRGDQAIHYEGARIPGLCVLSGAEFLFDPNQNFYTQFLDQVVQYVANHLIWLKTRRLYRLSAAGRTILYSPMPGELINEVAPKPETVMLPTGPIGVIDFWSGYWPGQKAHASTPLEHLHQIKRNQRCWCGLNRSYEACHRSTDIAMLPLKKQKRFLPAKGSTRLE